mmetsp:Transcript_1663/g.5797  ORF Transcript_1663/g.5797 Transcript_1663/m.5797 type:complete len:159 (+) Transcript_1663:2-478(+)
MSLGTTPPLIRAVFKNDSRAVLDILKDPRVDINCRDWKDFSALHYATIENKLEMVALLVEEGAWVDDASDQWTPLMMASSLGFARIVKYFIAQGADINRQNSLGNSLFWATISQHAHVVEILLAAGSLQKLNRLGFDSKHFTATYHSDIQQIYARHER